MKINAIVFYINCFHLFLIILTIFKTCLRCNYLFSNLIYLSFVDIKICSASYEKDIPKSSSVFSASCVAYACAFWNSSTAQRRRKLTAANSLPRTYKKSIYKSMPARYKVHLICILTQAAHVSENV